MRVLPLVIAICFLSGPARAADEVSLIFVGDTMLDGGPGHIITNGGDPFAAVAPVLRDADLTIGNLECAIVKQGQVENKVFTFRAPTEALPLLKKYFSAVSLANNHSGDWGKKGFLTELELLQEIGLPYFGGGSNRREAHQPLVLTVRGKRVALLGYNDFPPRRFAAGPSTPGTAWLAPADVVRDIQRVRPKADLVVLFLHWGDDLVEAVAPEQTDMAHRFIDAGADAVIGAHAHVTQSIEWYKDRPIVYSLGNFVFDYFPHDPPVWKGWMVKLSFGATGRPQLKTTEVTLDSVGLPHLVASQK